MNCNPIARIYRWLEYATFGKALERCRYSQLHRLQESTNALLLGDGDGRFLTAFALRNPKVTVDYVDVSSAMLALARRRLNSKAVPHAKRVGFHLGDVRTIDWPDRRYDLIACHFFFDVFAQAELAAVIGRIAQAAAPRAQWLVSEFDLPCGTLQRLKARILLRIMYCCFRLATGLANQKLPDWRPLLKSQGFSRKTSSQERGGFIVSELWTRGNPRVNAAEQ